MPNAIVMPGYGPPEVLKWAGVPLAEPGEGQVRIKVRAVMTESTWMMSLFVVSCGALSVSRSSSSQIAR
ncbi:MAG TPA: hypothetical protein VF060_33950 [Trebonia sp.]